MPVADEPDRLRGAASIAKFINSLFDPADSVSVKTVENWIYREVIPTHRFGGQVVASKARIRAVIDGEPIQKYRLHRGRGRQQLLFGRP
jgi:hypothetical protein